jgi:hypothetical protein
MKFWRPASPLSGLSYLKPGRSGRSSSYDRTGGNRDFAVVGPGAFLHRYLVWLTTPTQ